MAGNAKTAMRASLWNWPIIKTQHAKNVPLVFQVVVQKRVNVINATVVNTLEL